MDKNLKLKSLNTNWVIYLLILITLLGAILRIYKLGYSSFGLDEVYTLYTTSHGFISPGHPPLSFIIVYQFIKLFGTSEFTARVPSALFGIATIPLVYLLGKEIFGREEGLISSFIISTSLWHIKLSQEARMYTELTFFVIAAFYFFILGIKKINLKFLFASTFFLILAVYSHYSSILIIPVMLLYLVFSRKLLRKEIYSKTVPCFIIFFVFSIPLFPLILELLEFKLSDTARWGSPNMYFLLFTIYELRLGISLSLFSIFGAFYVLIRRNALGVLLILYAGIPLLIFSLITSMGNVTPRYLLFTLPAFALLASHILMELYRNLKIGKAISLGFVVIILFSFQNIGAMYDYYSHYGYFRHVERSDWKQAASFVELNMEVGDLIASASVPPEIYRHYPSPVEYYLKKPDFRLRDSDDFKMVANSSKRVWLFVGERDLRWMDKDNKVREWLNENCKIKKEIGALKVYLFDPSL